METADLYTYFKIHPKISTDTRKIEPGSIFFALKGANFNGNAFAGEALQKGAAFAVIDEIAFKKDERYLVVDDVLEALQALAVFHRKTLHIPVIGITGTNGKTTTKELLYAVLKQKYSTYATRGNLNNHIGVPLSLLDIQAETEIAIIEMGANHQQEIARLCQIARPTHGLITNVGKAHLEGFGSFEGVKRAKGELYDFIAETGGTLFLQGDNPILSAMVNERAFKEIKTYGLGTQNEVSGQLLMASPFLSIAWREPKKTIEVQTQLTGSYNTENVLAAVCVGQYFGVDGKKIKDGLAAYRPQNNRSQIVQTKRNTVICDYYNANASSMQAALDNLKSFPDKHKVVILGDMFELGEDTYVEHQKVITEALTLGAQSCIFVGKAFFEQKDMRAQFYENTQRAIEALRKRSITGALVLLKASRGMGFEKIMEVL